MKIIRSLFFLSLFGCFNNSNHTEESKKISGKDVYGAFLQDFRTYYPLDYFKHPFDTCILRGQIKKGADSVSSLPVFTFDNNMFFHDEQRSLSFSYSVFKNLKSGKSFFYGHYDAYTLDDVDTLEIKPFGNPALDNILRNTTIDKEADVVAALKPCIFNLYYTVLDEKSRIRVPMFPYVLPYWQFKKAYRNSANGKEFDELFPAGSKNNLLILENENLGALVFKIQVDQNAYKVEEFLVGSRTKIPLLKVDGPSSEYKNCE